MHPADHLGLVEFDSLLMKELACRPIMCFPYYIRFKLLPFSFVLHPQVKANEVTIKVLYTQKALYLLSTTGANTNKTIYKCKRALSSEKKQCS